MMFTVDGTNNLPCYGMPASGSSCEYLTISSTALCASAYVKDNEFFSQQPYNANGRSQIIALRLISLCDNFDREFFKPTSASSSMVDLLWRLFFF
ncbi:hypothetical protein Q1695_002145 [Nippostrongylus brasiliensis]|nr:hypothetical protein Q1695_002145 [Nippostrongylus brasiliensis]